MFTRRRSRPYLYTPPNVVVPWWLKNRFDCFCFHFLHFLPFSFSLWPISIVKPAVWSRISMSQISSYSMTSCSLSWNLSRLMFHVVFFITQDLHGPIKKTIKSLFLQVSLMDEMLTDSLFLDLARMCKTLNVATFMSSPSIHITSEALHEVYKVSNICKRFTENCTYNNWCLYNLRWWSKNRWSCAKWKSPLRGISLCRFWDWLESLIEMSHSTNSSRTEILRWTLQFTLSFLLLIAVCFRNNNI